MPSDFMFDVTLKSAEEALEDAVELDKHIFSLSKLAELSPSVYEAILGEDFVKAIVKSGSTTIDKEKLADNLFSLPKPDKSALEEHLAALFER
jgi:predicted KAP-like P-loop ATPase